MASFAKFLPFSLTIYEPILFYSNINKVTSICLFVKETKTIVKSIDRFFSDNKELF